MQSESFTDRFYRLLKERNMTQKQIGKLSGMSQNGISSWKVNGSIPRADVAIRMAKALKVPVEYLVFGEEQDIEPEVYALISEVKTLSKEKQRVIKDLIDALGVF